MGDSAIRRCFPRVRQKGSDALSEGRLIPLAQLALFSGTRTCAGVRVHEIICETGRNTVPENTRSEGVHGMPALGWATLAVVVAFGFVLLSEIVSAGRRRARS